MTKKLPLSAPMVIRVLVVLVIILALGLGYYHNQWEISQKQLKRLQLKYQTLEERVSTETVKP